MLAKTTVINAVSEYGAAWTTQDADRIAALFTEDAVYVERAFDRNGTFVGREQIREYWLCLLYTSPSPRDGLLSRMPSSA